MLDFFCHVNILLTYLLTKIRPYIRQRNLAGPVIAGYEKWLDFRQGQGHGQVQIRYLVQPYIKYITNSSMYISILRHKSSSNVESMVFLRCCPFAVRRLSFTECQFLLFDITVSVWHITLMWHTYHTRQNAVGT